MLTSGDFLDFKFTKALSHCSRNGGEGGIGAQLAQEISIDIGKS
jgi:hypothetical protein